MLPKTTDTYLEKIIQRYKEEKVESGLLMNPTPKMIKRICILKFNDSKDRRDKEILKKFFQFKEGKELKGIDWFKLDKLRPIQNLLLEKSKTDDLDKINLIALLVDFQPRPYYKYLRTNEEESNGGDGGIDIEFEEDPGSGITSSKPEKIPEKENLTKKVEDKTGKEIEKEPPREEPKYKKWILAIISFIAVSMICFYGATYFLANEKTNTETKPLKEKDLKNTEQKCMAWAETEYILADCTNNIHPEFKTNVRAYDESLLKNLKKVNVTIKTPFFEPNTRTPLIWYYKIGKGKFEYYTSYGLHPIFGEQLNDITQGHIDTYIPKYKNDEKSFLKE